MHHTIKAFEFLTKAEVSDKKSFLLNGIVIIFELESIVESSAKEKNP
jgi:hypothetical protein